MSFDNVIALASPANPSIKVPQFVPEELKAARKWLVYRLVWDSAKGKNDKKPFNPVTGHPANDPSLGVSYEEAIRYVDAYDGLGFYLEPPFVCIDRDKCRNPETGEIEPRMMDIVCDLDTYAEVSPSGTGVHIWFIGVKPGSACRKGEMEIYTTGRFMTFTGVRISETSHVYERDITSVYSRMVAGEFESKTPKTQLDVESGNAAGNGVQIVRNQPEFISDNLNDKIELLMHGGITSGSKPFVISNSIGRLTYTSQSEADMALCTLLAIKGLDAGQIDTEFRKSVLYRNKWERDDYRKDTITKAIRSVETEKLPAQVANWRSKFRNIAEMEQGDPVMIIEGVLQDGTCFLGAAPGHGKTLVALAIAKAISLGTPLFELPQFEVKAPHKVIYLIPETSDRPFRRRCEAFRLPTDDRFIARTITQGASLKLADPDLLEAVRQLRPVVILDTARRFNQSSDTNSDAENQKLVSNIIDLRAAGAVCVIILHHSTKAANQKKQAMTLENMLSGTGDFGAMCDQAYGIRMDENLYNRGSGPMEIEIVNLKDRERVGGLTSLRLAATYPKEGTVFPQSLIDETGNFRAVETGETMKRISQRWLLSFFHYGSNVISLDIRGWSLSRILYLSHYWDRGSVQRKDARYDDADPGSLIYTHGLTHEVSLPKVGKKGEY